MAPDRHTLIRVVLVTGAVALAVRFVDVEPGAWFVGAAASAIAVIGGTTGYLLAGGTRGDVGSWPQVLRRIRRAERIVGAPDDTKTFFTDLARCARGASLPVLVADPHVTTDPRLDAAGRRALDLAAGGMDADDVVELLELERSAIAAGMDGTVRLVRGAGIVCARIGKVVTIAALITMLAGLRPASATPDRPSPWGPEAAVAFTATWWGAILAVGVFSPAADRLRRATGAEELQRLLVLEGTRSMQAAVPPWVIEARLDALIARGARRPELAHDGHHRHAA